MLIVPETIAHCKKPKSLNSNEAASIVTGATKLVFINALFNETCLEALSS